jgi:tRNA-uridine 2-sulfurtransferase
MKAVALFSGGLDSAVAIKLIQDQGIDVIALNFVSPFCTCQGKGGCSVAELARRNGIPMKVMSKGMEYMKIVRNPTHGHGSGMNPCIDCRIFILKAAKRFAKDIDARFIFTGEVIGQRPMSQRRNVLDVIEKEAGLKGKLLRPLSAKLLPPTEAELKGWVDRTRLMALSGRRRAEQMDAARKLDLDGFLCGGGGCRLCDKEYAEKVRDLFRHSRRFTLNDIQLLNYGRHFRHEKARIVVGRRQSDNEGIIRLRAKGDYVLEAADCVGPTTLLRGSKTKDAIQAAAKLTARYSDAKAGSVRIRVDKARGKTIISVIKADEVSCHKDGE